MVRLRHLEKKGQRLASTRSFLARLSRNFLAASLFMAVSLAIGTVGYHYLGGVPWLDGLLNAAMILTGMGPVDRMETPAGKLFATFYALYSGLAFLVASATLLAPVYHRLIHHFHLECEGDDRDRSRPGGVN